MADNTPVTNGSGDVYRSKDRSAVKTQVVGIDVGIGTGTESLMSSTAPLPTYGPDVTATGTITVTDSVVAAPAGAGALVSGSSTAGSLVAIQNIGGDSSWMVQVTSLTSGTLYFEGSLDSTNGTDGNWINLNGRRTGIVNTQLGGSATANGVWRGNTAGLKYLRIRSVGTLTGTPAIRWAISDGPGAIFLNASIPAGSNLIGTIGKAPAATGTITTPALAITSFTVLAANTARLGATITNDSVNNVYIALASTASTTSYTALLLASGGYYELPSDACGYTGIITGISAVASGNLRVTELTA